MSENNSNNIKNKKVSIYSLSQLASILGVSTALIRRWCKKNQIEYKTTDSGHIFFTEDMMQAISTWYKNIPPKKGRPRNPDGQNHFSLSEAARKLHINVNDLRQWVIEKKVPHIVMSDSNFHFTVEQMKEVQKFASEVIVQNLYSSSEAARLLNIDPEALRLLSRLNKVGYFTADSGRIMFTLDQVNSIRKQLEAGLPLLESNEIAAYSKQKKDYYKQWYRENREEVRARRRRAKYKPKQSGSYPVNYNNNSEKDSEDSFDNFDGFSQFGSLDDYE